MTRILGIDPGATTGWCLYVDTDMGRYVEACGEFDSHKCGSVVHKYAKEADYVVVESLFKPHGNIYPATVVSAITEGRLVEGIARERGFDPDLMTRHDVKKILTAATHRTMIATDDKTVWRALVLLHGDGSDRKPKRKGGKVVDEGGPLGRVTGHARAALAVAVAYVLRQGMPAGVVL